MRESFFQNIPQAARRRHGVEFCRLQPSVNSILIEIAAECNRFGADFAGFSEKAGFTSNEEWPSIGGFH